MNIIGLGETKHGHRAVLVEPDTDNRIFRAFHEPPISAHGTSYGPQRSQKTRMESPWIRLTGPAVDEAPLTDLNDEILKEWLPRTSGRLAVVESVVVAFPSNADAAPAFNRNSGWYLIPGPADAALQQVPIPQARQAMQLPPVLRATLRAAA